MERIANRLRRLEARTPPPAPGRPGSVTGAELRSLEEHIRRQEAGSDEVRAAPEADVVKSVEPDDRVAAVVREIERLEQLDHARDEGTRWEK